MKTNDRLTNVIAIAERFAARIRHELTAEQFRQVLDRNRDRKDSSCATHDFVDANMVLADAFEDVMLIPCDPHDESHHNLMNAAHRHAIDMDLFARFDDGKWQTFIESRRFVADLEEHNPTGDQVAGFIYLDSLFIEAYDDGCFGLPISNEYYSSSHLESVEKILFAFALQCGHI